MVSRYEFEGTASLGGLLTGRKGPGVPNGTLRQYYLETALVANSQEVVDVDMLKVVALPALF